VLIQPWVAFDAGGTAVADGDGAVRVVAAAAPPDALVAGRASGTEVRIAPDDRSAGAAGVERAILRAVADLALRVRAGTGLEAIEWGSAGGRLALLQVRRAPSPMTAGAGAPTLLASRRSFPPVAERLAGLAARYPGPLGERLVLSWALALADVPGPSPLPVADPVAALARAEAAAGDLAARAWSRPAPAARLEAAETMRSVLGPDPEPALARLSGLRPVEPAAAALVVALVSGIGEHLAAAGALARPELVWRLSPEELVAFARGVPVPERTGPDRWEPFVVAVAAGNGRRIAASPAAPGIGAGRLRVLGRSPEAWRPSPREVLAVAEPAPHVAPLLWNAAGLVSAGGGAGAHLFEVARSLGVPAVVGASVPQVADGTLAAVDGSAGVVSLLEGGRERASGAGA
jgi:phosphohistidine swiveling domain-containing protein